MTQFPNRGAEIVDAEQMLAGMDIEVSDFEVPGVQAKNPTNQC
ncbi:hypothetical protein [Streptomyces wedmorensis]